MKNNLKEVRVAAGLSLQELADMYGGTKPHCWCLERGKNSPKLNTAYAIAKVLNKTVYDIWPDETEMVEETIIIRRVKRSINT